MICNRLQITNLKVRHLLVVIFSIQLSLWGLIILDTIGFSFSGIRQQVGLIYLVFVPGILILQILNLNKLSLLQTLLYIVGTSVSVLMFIGFFMNIFYPTLGIADPISIVPLILTISAIVIILCFFCYFRTKDITYVNKKRSYNSKCLLSSSLFLFLVLLLSVLGTYYVNYLNNNILLMIMIFFVGIIILLIAFDKFIPTQLYPLAVWVISISLILHYTLITNYAGVHDGEFGYAKMVIENHIWKWNNYGNYNSILSITLLPAIFSIVCNINLTWIYKLVFPFFLSLIPLAIYSMSRIYFNEKMSFLSSCIFAINSEFFEEMPLLAKQTMATFFLILLYTIFLNKEKNKSSMLVLTIMFSASLVVSHYGTSFLVMISYIFLLFALYLTKTKFIHMFIEKLTGHDNYLTKKMNFMFNSLQKENISFSFNFILLFVVLSFSWYIYISGSSVLYSLVSISNSIWRSLLSDFLNPDYSRGAYMLTKEYTGLRLIHKYLKLGVIVLIIMGFFRGIYNYGKSKFSLVYLFFSAYYLILLIASVVIPHFSVMSPGRLYILGLCILSPLFVVAVSQTDHESRNLKILFIFTTILMLFTTQFIYVLAQDSPTSISIGQQYVKEHGDEDTKAQFYSDMIIEYDISSLEWLSTYGSQKDKLFFTGGYTNIGSVYHNMGFFPINQIYGEYLNCYKELLNPNKYQYIMLIYANVVENIGFSTDTNATTFSYFNFSKFKPVLEKRNKIYDNGGNNILWNY